VSLFSTENLQYHSLKRGKIGRRLLLMTNRKSHIYALSIGAKINDLGWPWRAITHSVSKHMRLSEPTMKIWMKIDPYYQRRRCSPMTLDSGNIRFMRTLVGFSGDWASSNSEVIKNVDFQGFRTLRLRHLRQWARHYYIVLFSSTSPFH